MTIERFFSLLGNGLFAVVMLLFLIVCCIYVLAHVANYVADRGWKKVWREIVVTAKVLAWVVVIVGGLAAALAGIGWLVDHFLNFNVTDI